MSVEWIVSWPVTVLRFISKLSAKNMLKIVFFLTLASKAMYHHCSVKASSECNCVEYTDLVLKYTDVQYTYNSQMYDRNYYQI